MFTLKDPEIRSLIVEILDPYGAYIEDDTYDLVQDWLESFQGETLAELRSWIEEKAKASFLSFNGPPKWVQDTTWPFFEGKPMIFIGAIQCNATLPNGEPFFHDYTTFFLFIPNGRWRDEDLMVIVQQY